MLSNSNPEQCVVCLLFKRFILKTVNRIPWLMNPIHIHRIHDHAIRDDWWISYFFSNNVSIILTYIFPTFIINIMCPNTWIFFSFSIKHYSTTINSLLLKVICLIFFIHYHLLKYVFRLVQIKYTEATVSSL